MRYNLTKKHSTKPERVVHEILKELHIPFRHRWIIEGLEIDFLIGRYAIEINGHEQDGGRNHKLKDLGYVPIHFHNKEVISNRRIIKNKLKEIYEYN